MKKNNWIVPALVIVGLGLIAFSIFGTNQKLQIGSSRTALARISEKSGHVTLQNNEMPAEIEVSSNNKLESRDLLRTSEGSEALIEFDNGGQFRMTEKSEVLVDRLENGNSLVVIRSGDIFIEKFGKSPSYSVRKDGQMYSAVDYALLEKKNASHLKEAIPDRQSQEQISQIEIESVLNSKKNDFFKCFGQLIQKNPQAGGQVLISFTIETQGHTSKVEISKSDITDPHFKSCLLEVVARVQFRQFTGSPVATVFPLKFE